MPYKDFSVFSDIQPVFGEVSELNHGFTAVPKVAYTKHTQFDNDCFLLFRRSEYAAQVELACAEIFKMFMGYGPVMEIIQNEGKFYIASRRIKNFRVGYPDSTKYPNINGLAAIRILDYFLCSTDNHSHNFGIQSIGENGTTFRLDMAEHLDLVFLSQTLEVTSLSRIPYIAEEHFNGDGPEWLPVSHVMSPFFQDEKQRMIQKIAQVSFEVLETILRNTITTSPYLHARAMTKISITLSGDDSEAMREIADSFAKINPDEYSLDHMIELLRARHSRWQVIVSATSVIEQDLTLSDPMKLHEESQKYHGGLGAATNDEESERSDIDVHASPLDVPEYNRSRLFALRAEGHIAQQCAQVTAAANPSTLIS